MIRDFARVVWDDESHKYYVVRPDDPGNEYKEITFGAIMDLQSHLRRYVEDWVNENRNRLDRNMLYY